MSSRYLLPLLALLALALPGCQQESSAPRNSTAVVDMMRVMRDSVPGKAGVKYLESIQSEMQKKLDEIQARLEKDPKNEGAMQDLQKVYAASQQRMQAEQQNVVNMLNDTIQRVLNAYREKHNLEVIIASDAAMAYSPKIDVTEAIIGEVDRQKVEFANQAEAGAKQPEEAAKTAGQESGADKPAGKKD